MSAIANRIAAVATAALVGLATIASSQAGEADVKYRQNVMKANSAHAGSIGSWVKGEITDEAGIKHQAMALYANAQSVE